jgi:hypothetical protein
MDEISTVDTYRRLGSRVRCNLGTSGHSSARSQARTPPATVHLMARTVGPGDGLHREHCVRGAAGRGLAETGGYAGSEMANDAATAGDRLDLPSRVKIY